MRFVEVDEGIFVNLDTVEFVALKTLRGDEDRFYFVFVFPNTSFELGEGYTEPVAYSRIFSTKEEALRWFRNLVGATETAFSVVADDDEEPF